MISSPDGPSGVRNLNLIDVIAIFQSNDRGEKTL